MCTVASAADDLAIGSANRSIHCVHATEFGLITRHRCGAGRGADPLEAGLRYELGELADRLSPLSPQGARAVLIQPRLARWRDCEDLSARDHDVVRVRRMSDPAEAGA